jgi:hypothetical protein
MRGIDDKSVHLRQQTFGKNDARIRPTKGFCKLMLE